MVRLLSISVAVFAVIHGLIHLMGFVAYWPLAPVSELPYKTSLLGGRLELGSAGMRLFSLLWLLAALLWIVGGLLLVFRQPSWAPLMLGVALFSLGLCILDWGPAFRGALIDLVFLLILFVVFGLRLPPDPFPAYTADAAFTAETLPFPPGLPAPVERYYRLVYPDGRLPVYHTAVLTGRGSLTIMGVTIPARMRFTHIAGHDYRHYIENTFFGIPFLKVSEHFLAGHARLELPIGVTENEPVVDSAANQGLWAEMNVYPASYLSDRRARWEAVDDQTARLYIPWQDGEQVFTVRFDPLSGRMLSMETMRHRDAQSGIILWTTNVIFVPARGGRPARELAAATWADQGFPWLIFELEEKDFNTDVTDYIRQRGP